MVLLLHIKHYRLRSTQCTLTKYWRTIEHNSILYLSINEKHVVKKMVIPLHTG